MVMSRRLTVKDSSMVRRVTQPSATITVMTAVQVKRSDCWACAVAARSELSSSEAWVSSLVRTEEPYAKAATPATTKT